MDPIITITFHPCIDVNVSVAALVPDIKLPCTQVQRQPGGGGINVARAIRKLGGKATAILMAGGVTGDRLSQLLAEEGVPTVVLEVEGETRENIIIRDEKAGCQYRCNLPGPPIPEAALEDMLILLEKGDGIRWLVVSGSMAPGMKTDIYSRLGSLAERKGIRLVVDTAGEALRAALRSGVYLVKPSLHELKTITSGRRDGTDIEDRAQQFLAESRCEAVIVSLGPDGALLAARNGCRRFPAPEVAVASTVGAGDSMVAGIILSLDSGMPLERSVAFGVICGAAATLRPGTGLCRPEDVNRLKHQIEAHEKDPVH
jgi:6-phosphofructokinase 2